MKTNRILPSILSAITLFTFSANVGAESSYLDWFTLDESTLISTPTAGVDVTLDSRGNAITAGYIVGNPTAWRVVSHDALSGLRNWSRLLTTTPHNSQPVKVLVDAHDNVIVSGWSGGSNGKDYRTIKYDGVTGNQLWSQTYNGILSFSIDEVVDMVIDSNNDVIVTGFSQENGSQYDIVTIKYNGTNGNAMWSTRYASGGYDDRPSAMALLPGTDDVIVTGKSRTKFEDPSCFVTLRYDGATGSQEWVQLYESPYAGRDEALDVAVTIYGVYVVGRSGLQMGQELKFQNTVVSYSLFGTPGWVTSLPHWVNETRSKARIKATSATHLTVASHNELASDRYCIYLTTLSRLTGAAFDSSDTRPPGYQSGDPIQHTLGDLVLDSANRPILIGNAYETSQGNQVMVEKYASSNGTHLFSQRIPGGSGVTSAVDMTNGIIVVGTVSGQAAAGAPQRMITVRYGSLPLKKGDQITSSSLSPAAVVRTIGTPTTGRNGEWLSRVVIKDGAKSLRGIRKDRNFVTKVQGAAIPALIPNASLLSFGDPISAHSGDYAYTAKLSGVPLAQSNSVWVNFNGGDDKVFLQTGKTMPGMGDALLRSVVNIGLSPNYLAVLVRLNGSGVTSKNALALVTMTSPTIGYKILRTGDMVQADGFSSPVKSIRIFTPNPDSAGYNRAIGDTRLIANAGLVDGRSVMLSFTHTGVRTVLLATGGAANIVASGAKWKSFGEPAIPANGNGASTLATLQIGPGGITSSNDSAIVTCGTLGGAWTTLAKESAVAPGTGGALFASFTAPIKDNAGYTYFMAKLKGPGVTTANNTSLWMSSGSAPTLVVRTGEAAVDRTGNNALHTLASIRSFALPHTSNARPLFLATVKGQGITLANNTALYAFDSNGYLRELLRTGRQVGTARIKSITVLKTVRGGAGASRSFNSQSVVSALVTLTDGTHAVMQVRVP